MFKAAVIGKDGRTSAIEKALRASAEISEVINLSDWKSEPPAIARQKVIALATKLKPDFVVIGPEEPLAEGVVDDLQNGLGIACIGPTKNLARLESSKTFTRNLLSEFSIPGNPQFRAFNELSGIEDYIASLPGYVIKPDGLTGGKGVKLSDSHLFSVAEAVDYCKEILESGHERVIVEEKLDGEEFSLMSFCDGTHVSDMVVVQDHKRVGEDDTGPNTGGMGSYSCENHRLPFLTQEQLQEASAINLQVAKALRQKTGQKYKGILYGGFMVTAGGLRLLEYNARFGDPETLNVLSILQTDFGRICRAIIEENLHELPITFARKATVCKYVVPNGYPENPIRNVPIDLSKVPQESENLRIFNAAVEERNGRTYLTGSRAIAFVGIGNNLAEAESFAEAAANRVGGGTAFHRRDIGTTELVQKRVDHVNSLLCCTRTALKR